MSIKTARLIKLNGDGSTEYPKSYGSLQKEYPICWPENPTEDTVAAYDYYPVEIDPYPTINPVTQTAEEDYPILEGGKWVVHWTVSIRPLEDVKAHVRDRISRKAEEIRDGGITVDLGAGPIEIASDREARDDIASVKHSTKISRKRKLSSGLRVILTKQLSDALYNAMDDHVEAVDAWEYDRDEEAENATDIATLEAILNAVGNYSG